MPDRDLFIATSQVQLGQDGNALQTLVSLAENQISVANLLFDLDEPSEAAMLYVQSAPYPIDSDIGRRFLRSLLEADMRAALRERLDLMPADEKTNEFYLWIEAALLERIGKLPEALDLLGAVLRSRPEAAGLRLSWLGLLERLGRTADLLSFLKENSDGTPLQQLHYAHLLKRNGLTEEALHLGYQTARSVKRDPSVHLAYVGLIFSTHHFQPFSQTTVVPDQGFVFASRSEGRRTFIVEEGEPFGDMNILPPDHPIALAAMGKRVGDVFEIEEGPYTRIAGHIVEVRHKYLILNDDFIHNFN